MVDKIPSRRLRTLLTLEGSSTNDWMLLLLLLLPDTVSPSNAASPDVEDDVEMESDVDGMRVAAGGFKRLLPPPRGGIRVKNTEARDVTDVCLCSPPTDVPPIIGWNPPRVALSARACVKAIVAVHVRAINTKRYH